MKTTDAEPSAVLSRVDHLVYAVPDLDAGIVHIEQLLGVRATAGGRHSGRGTRNALLALGPRTYLEIIGPDPAQINVAKPFWFGVDRLAAPALVTWAARASDLERVVEKAAHIGVTLGNVIAGSRKRTDGIELHWRYTDPLRLIADGIVPFFIDWADTPHPASSAAQGAALTQLRAEHPEPERVQEMLRGLELEISVGRAPLPALIATVDCARGRIELR